MFPAARMTDPVTHDMLVPSGVIMKGQPNVLIEFMPAARITDIVVCSGAISAGLAHPPPPPTPPLIVAKGCPKVLVGGLPLGRWIIDTTACGAFLGDPKMLAMRKVFVGP
jgi:uncharacterized Zn-binding protein involved in type VI secretion